MTQKCFRSFLYKFTKYVLFYTVHIYLRISVCSVMQCKVFQNLKRLTFIEHGPVEDGDEEGDGRGGVLQHPLRLNVPRQHELSACHSSQCTRYIRALLLFKAIEINQNIQVSNNQERKVAGKLLKNFMLSVQLCTQTRSNGKLLILLQFHIGTVNHRL